ncbi:hypothetical protein RPD76_17630 [Methylomonas sp. MV1]|nr:hypothetical protein [Methylomonas sp. MV1]MDT4331742.1 hypothetical protein [Methylomonas sp. MV1]
MLLATAKRRVIGLNPIKAKQFQYTGDHPAGLPLRQTEQVFDHQTKPDRRILKFLGRALAGHGQVPANP